MDSKPKAFRELLHSDRTEFLMEAHNGLSARIVEETGFSGIWASGLSISASMGVRDNNEMSWTQVLEIVEFMSDASSLPILLDGDTGYGNFNNMRRLVRKLEDRGIAAVCIEDKLFPKTNSFIGGEKQPLADIDEFVGKIKAAKDGQRNEDFSVVARLEAFIAGWGVDEMLRRADAYHDAGADALLIHSKLSVPDQILEFAASWKNRCPLVIVPTMYYSTPVEVFEEAGISIVIWANHNIRSSITAMEETTRRIFEQRSLTEVEDRVASVKDIFRLQNAAELSEAEDLYLPKRAESIRAVILASAKGGDFGRLNRELPKAMMPVAGRPLLEHLVGRFREQRINDIVVVRGFGKEQVKVDNVRFVDNDEHEETGELWALSNAMDEMKGDLVISYGDILFRKYILLQLLDENADITLVVDAAWKDRESFNGGEDFVEASEPHRTKHYGEDDAWLKQMKPGLSPNLIHGEWIGLVKTTPEGTRLLREALLDLKERENFAELQMFDLFNHLLESDAKIRVSYISGHWLDVDDLDDLTRAQTF